MNYLYNAKIKVTLYIWDTGAEQEDVISPKDSSYTEAEWNALSEAEREAWVRGLVDKWSQNHITLEYAIVKP